MNIAFKLFLFSCFSICAFAQTNTNTTSLSTPTLSPNLSERKLAVGEYTNMAKALAEPEKVLMLNLFYKFQDVVPSDISKFKNLKKLDLSHNNLSFLPESIGELQNLEILDLQGNQLTSLPSSICKLKKLKVLNLGNNLISSLPENINELSQLEFLSLDNCKLDKLPTRFFELVNLKELYLSPMWLTDFKGIGKLTGLKKLVVSFRYGQEAIPEIWNLSNMESLNINWYTFDSVPEGIYKLKKLKYVWVHFDNEKVSLNQKEELKAKMPNAKFNFIGF